LNLEIVDVTDCRKNLVAEVPVEQVEEEIDQLARRYAQRVKVPGFRPGKVPLTVVRQRFGAELRSDAAQDIIHRTLKQTLQERGLRPLGEPVVEKLESEPGVALKFTVSFEVMPELAVTDYRGVTAVSPAVSIQEADVEAALENLRNMHAQFVPVEDDVVQDGHFVTVSIDGDIEGGGKAMHGEERTVVVGAPETQAEFSENLRGAAVDETRSFHVAYPEEHRQKRLAGKRVHYQVKVKEIKEKQLQDLNEDFARDLGASSLEELRNRTRDELVTQARQAAEEKARESALDQIVRRQTFSVPETLVREELESHARRIAANLARQGIDIGRTSIDWKKVFEEERPHAEQSVRRQMVLSSVARQEGLEVTEEEVDAAFQKMAQRGGKSAAAMRAQFEKDQRLQAFRMYLLQNKALDFIIRNATISEG
jgi:trigger factor